MLTFIYISYIYVVVFKTGKCVSMLPSPPTTSPTSSDRTAPFWYPDYESPWSHATCLNTLPLPYKYANDRPNYSSAKECCKMAYAGQMSKACVCSLDSPPTRCPNVVKFEVIMITSVVTSTLNLGSITVPMMQAREKNSRKIWRVPYLICSYPHWGMIYKRLLYYPLGEFKFVEVCVAYCLALYYQLQLNSMQ